MRYVVSYDLNSPGHDYDSLISALERSGAKRVLQSQWCGRWNNSTARKLCDYFWQFMDSNDCLLVNALDGANWAGMNLLSDPNNM